MQDLLIVHGAFEYGDNYRMTADWLAPHGYRVHTPSLRGHHGAPGRPMYIRDVQEYVQDLRQYLDSQNIAQPYAILAHSMGGLVALRAIQSGVLRPEKLLLSSPFLAVPRPIPRPVMAVAGALAGLWEYFWLPAGVNNKHLTHDKALVEARNKDKNVRRRLTVRWYQAIVRAQQQAMEEAGKVQVPTWLFTAGADKIVNVPIQQQLFERLPQGVMQRVYTGMYHEILKELDREQVLQDVLKALKGS